MKTMSKTAALKTASKAVGAPMGRGTDWVFYAPYYSDKLDGPSSEIRANSYPAILRHRTERVVETALELMGITEIPYLYDLSGDARSMLNEVLANPGRYLVANSAGMKMKGQP